MGCSADRRRAGRRVAAGLAGLAALALSAGAPRARAADIYRCVDEDGVVHFSNAPTRDCFVRIITVKPSEPPRPASQAAAEAAAAEVQGLVRYEGLIAEAAARHKVQPALIKAVIRAESNFDPKAVSRKGAQGLMQLMPETAGLYGLTDPFEPRGNIDAGAKHLRRLIDRYRDLRLALAAYNAGEETVERYGRRVPPFAETQGYIRAVLRHLEAYGGGTRTASR